MAAAVEMLQAGGNAIDAAVAAAWALSVCEPGSSGLGGQTILLIRFADGRMLVVDGHSRAPAAVSRSRVSHEDQQRGFRACTIPSTPATLDYAQRRYGVLPRATVMEPAGVEAGTGILSSVYVKDPDDPAWKDDPGVKAWREFMTRYVPEADQHDTNYVNAGRMLAGESIYQEYESLAAFGPNLLNDDTALGNPCNSWLSFCSFRICMPNPQKSQPKR